MKFAYSTSKMSQKFDTKMSQMSQKCLKTSKTFGNTSGSPIGLIRKSTALVFKSPKLVTSSKIIAKLRKKVFVKISIEVNFR